MELTLTVEGLPPAKNEAISMLGPGHSHRDRVVALLAAAKVALASSGNPSFGSSLVGMDVCIYAPNLEVPGDATNYLGGIGDVLEDKSRRGLLSHIGELATVSLFDNDRQIREVHFYIKEGATYKYEARVWKLEKSGQAHE